MEPNFEQDCTKEANNKLNDLNLEDPLSQKQRGDVPPISFDEIVLLNESGLTSTIKISLDARFN